uniref:Putative proteasome prosome n=1 Tax=Ixodes ricinus TaxID=34613 RepID=A0A131Y8L9_IXORI
MSDSWVCTLAYDGKFEALKQQFCSDKTIISKKDLAGRIPLHWAVSGKRKDIVNFLLQQGSPVDCADEAQWTALMIASSVGHADIVSSLLERGAQVNAVNQTGHTSLHYAASKGHLEVARLLLEQHADVNARDHMGSTPLHRAASLGHDHVVRLFLEGYRNKLDLDARDAVGNTPLHLACEEDRSQTARLLVQAGCRTDVPNKEEKTALQVAAPSLRRMIEVLVAERESRRLS